MRPSKIILISIDTLRADRLGCYGYGRPTSPNLDRLAGEGVMYPNVFSACPYTVPTHASLLTGLYPANHNVGFRLREGRIDPDSTVFIQEILRSEGYKTAAFMSALVLRKGWGLDWGFDLYDDNMTGTEKNRTDQLIRDGRDTNKAALEWMSTNRDGDFFVWIHYFDVHGPYVQPTDHAGPFRPEEYGDTPFLLDKVTDGQPGGIPEYQLLDAARDERGELTGYQKDLRHYLAAYDNGVKYQDAVIGELFDGLKNEGIYEESSIIVTADHGEALGEDGVFFFHGLTVTPEQSRVPLIIKSSASSEKKAACDSPVSTVDIMPTILDCVGFSGEGLGLDGVSLDTPDPDRFVLSENEWQRAVIWREFYLLQEKDAVFDGFCYYFDSQELCRGTRLIEYRTGRCLVLDPQGPAGELIRYAESLRRLVDPKERWSKDKDRQIMEMGQSISELGRVIDGKDSVIAHKDNVIAQRDGIIAQRNETIAQRNETIAQRDGIIAQRDGIIAQRDEAIAHKTNEIRVNAAMIRKLEDELGSVYNSKSWRFTYPLRWVSTRLKRPNE